MAARTVAKTLCVWIVATAALFSSSISSAAGQPENGSPAVAFNEYRAGQPRFTLPFYLFNGHILIDGAVNGRAGKFMFDTGTEFPFFLNNHFLSLARDQLVFQGHAGSGQEMLIYRQNAPVASIEIAGQIRFENTPALLHADWSFLEQAYTPHFLGTIGHGFNRNYLFVIDYEAQTITFHALDQDEGVLASVIDPARVVTTLAFTPVGVDGKMPELELQIGDETITTFFDTGSHGTLELTEPMKKALEERGYLKLAASEHTYGTYQTHTRVTLQGLRHGAQMLHDARNLDFKTGSKNRLGLGYHFLKNYISVWDYSRRTLTLLRP